MKSQIIPEILQEIVPNGTNLVYGINDSGEILIMHIDTAHLINLRNHNAWKAQLAGMSNPEKTGQINTTIINIHLPIQETLGRISPQHRIYIRSDSAEKLRTIVPWIFSQISETEGPTSETEELTIEACLEGEKNQPDIPVDITSLLNEYYE